MDPANSGNYNVNCDNPFLSAQQAGIMCSPAQLAFVAANPGAACTFAADGTSPNCANVNIGRRNVEGGGGESYYEHNNYRAVVSSQGDLGSVWKYDAYAQYYYTTFFNINKQYLNFASIDNALQIKGTAANPVCISGPPCVPYNIFNDGGVTQAALQYMYLNGSAYGTNSQRIAHADVTGDLGKYGVKSPFATDGLSINVGYEHRAEQQGFDPDSGEQSGLLSGFGGALVQDKPGVANLTVDTGFRHSDYSTSGGVNTGKFEVQYQPVSSVRIRGSLQRAIRAPNLIELYTPAIVGLVTAGEDPCAPSAFTGVIAATLQQCMRTGVTAAQYNSGSIPQGTGSQLSAESGGNTQLKPEKATSYSFGVTYTPPSIPGLSGSIDYYQIKLTDEIVAIPAALLLQQCLNTGDPLFCSKVVRNLANGSLTGATLFGGGYFVQTALNIGAQTLSGIDLQGTYRQPLPDGFGSLSFALNGAYLIKSETQSFPRSPTYDCAGLFGVICATVDPRWRHNFRTTWNMPWNVELAATWRFIGKVSLDNNDPNPLLYGHTFRNPHTGGPRSTISTPAFRTTATSTSLPPGRPTRA